MGTVYCCSFWHRNAHRWHEQITERIIVFLFFILWRTTPPPSPNRRRLPTLYYTHSKQFDGRVENCRRSMIDMTMMYGHVGFFLISSFPPPFCCRRGLTTPTTALTRTHVPRKFIVFDRRGETGFARISRATNRRAYVIVLRHPTANSRFYLLIFFVFPGKRLNNYYYYSKLSTGIQLFWNIRRNLEAYSCMMIHFKK